MTAAVNALHLRLDRRDQNVARDHAVLRRKAGLEVAGVESTFRLAWECARPNAIVTIVALYDKAQSLPLPDMYGKNFINYRWNKQ